MANKIGVGCDTCKHNVPMDCALNKIKRDAIHECFVSLDEPQFSLWEPMEDSPWIEMMFFEEGTDELLLSGFYNTETGIRMVKFVAEGVDEIEFDVAPEEFDDDEEDADTSFELEEEDEEEDCCCDECDCEEDPFDECNPDSTALCMDCAKLDECFNHFMAHDEVELQDGCPHLDKPDSPDNDIIKHPSHYTETDIPSGIECWDHYSLGMSEAEFRGAMKGNIYKYVWRTGKKDPAKSVEDLKKARAYLDRWIKYEEGERLVWLRGQKA